jgi:FKBP-type peptidyl-prolyl cis-trans isomerase FklB
MKRILLAILAIGLLSTSAFAGEAPVLKTDKDRLSYSIGVDIGRNFKRLGTDIDVDVMAKAMKDAMMGAKPLLDENELRQIMGNYQAELRRKQAQVRRSAGNENLVAGQKFLEENKKKEGVVALPSGLQYKVIKAGDGKKPAESDSVECFYRGTLLDGKEFDASPPGQTALFELAKVIPGWREALKLMPVGSKWQLFVPPQLAYGDRGAGRDIGPNTTLIFEVELVGIK